MPNTKSAKKALRRDQRREARNKKKKKKFRDTIKDFKKMVEAGQTQEAKEFLPQVQKAIDKATKKNLIHQNKADRLKSQMSKKLES